MLDTTPFRYRQIRLQLCQCIDCAPRSNSRRNKWRLSRKAPRSATRTGAGTVRRRQQQRGNDGEATQRARQMRPTWRKESRLAPVTRTAYRRQTCAGGHNTCHTASGCSVADDHSTRDRNVRHWIEPPNVEAKLCTNVALFLANNTTGKKNNRLRRVWQPRAPTTSSGLFKTFESWLQFASRLTANDRCANETTDCRALVLERMK